MKISNIRIQTDAAVKGLEYDAAASKVRGT